MWQANHVAQLLCQVEPTLDVVMVPSDTFADLDLERSIAELGGKGAFSKEIQQVVLAGHADIAVHSAKDLQALTPPGLTVAAYPTRGDARDALVGITLDQLQDRMVAASASEMGVVGAARPLLGSGSNRRRALVLDVCPDVDFADLRGNIATRLARLEGSGDERPDLDGLVMAAVALERLGIEPDVVDVLDPEVFVPQVGQGALAVEVRTEERELRALVAEIDDPVTRLAVEAERSFLAELGGDCLLPAGAHATVAAVDKRIQITISGILADEDCRNIQRMTERGTVDIEPGRVLARSLRKSLEGQAVEAPNP
jgi:hydroxymethylbilane synthase